MAKLTFGKRRRRVNYDLLREIVVWTFQIAIVCFLAFVCVHYFGQRVSMIGDSMKPELANGNITLISKAAYSMGTPKRGDVVAFKPNGNESSHYYIKRIVGLPGETVEVQEGKIVVDGREIRERYKPTEIDELGLLSEPVTLKNNEYFVLGDNRNNSSDSRDPSVGNIHEDQIIGKVFFRVWPFKSIQFF